MRSLVLACLLSLPAAAAEPSEVERWLAARVADGSASAAAFAAIDGADIRTSGFGARADGNGKPGADTQFQAGSVTKVFTNILLAELDQDGKLDADATTLGQAYGRDLAPRNEAVADITLVRLATHTSGLPRMPANIDHAAVDPYSGYDAAELLAGLNLARDKQPLGRFYTYSNFGMAVLGEALGRIDGRGYRIALTERVIGPLNLKRTGFTPDADRAAPTQDGKVVAAWGFDAFAPAGALWTSAGDLAYLVGTYFGMSNSLQHDRGRDGERVADGRPFAVSRIWHLAPAKDATILWHNGATRGFHAIVAFRQDTQRGLVVLLAGEADPTQVVLAALGHVPAKPAAQAIDASVAGQYALTPAFGMGVFERNGALVVQATGQPAFQLHPLGNDWYALGEADASVRFVRDGGRVQALELAQGGVIQSAKRVADVATAATQREIELPADALADYAGEYQFAPGVVLGVRQRDGGIEAQLSGQPWFPVYASAKDRFFYRVVDARLTFSRDAAGQVDAVTLHQGGIDQKAPRKR